MQQIYELYVTAPNIFCETKYFLWIRFVSSVTFSTSETGLQNTIRPLLGRMTVSYSPAFNYTFCFWQKYFFKNQQNVWNLSLLSLTLHFNNVSALFWFYAFLLWFTWLFYIALSWLLTLSGLAFENHIKGRHGADSALPMENTFRLFFGEFLSNNLERYIGGSHAKQKAKFYK